MRGMTGTSRGLLVLGVGGAVIALIANFGPYLSPLPLDPTITPVGSLFALVGSLLWAGATAGGGTVVQAELPVG